MVEMAEKAIQDSYDEAAAVCYGCGRLNEHGLHVKSYWDGEEAVCHFKPEPYHTAIPGYVYGGLLASLIDCHSTGTAAAASYDAEERSLGSAPPIRFVTGSLHVDYLRPTPIDAQLEIRAWVKELKGRKVVVQSSLYANGEETVRGEALCVRMPEHLLE